MSKKLSTLNMKKIIIALFILFTSVVYAQSNLPTCNGDYSGACFGKRIYDNGEYIGELLNGSRHGQGFYSWSMGTKYIGKFSDNKLNGFGTYYNAKGVIDQEGFWKDGSLVQANISLPPSNLSPCNGIFSGPCFGSYVWPDSDKYTGEFLDGLAHGKGVYYYSNGERSTGEFRNGIRNGQITHTWPNGQQYIGESRNGYWVGKGIIAYVSGDRYEGQWSDSKKNGQGIYIWLDGSKFIGEFKNNIRNGQGTQYDTNGSIKQQGLWRDDVFIQAQNPPVISTQSNLPACTTPPFNYCYGEWKYDNGIIYIGEWLYNQKSGRGISTWPDGDKYVGQYKDDTRNGQGTYTFNDGKKYVGQWKEGKRNGQGVLYNANGIISQQGLWRDDVFVQVPTPPPVKTPVAPKPPVPISNPQDIKRQKCINLGLAPNSADFQQCMN